MRVAIDAVCEEGKLAEGAICYAGDILDPARSKFPLAYYLGMARELEKAGCHILAIKDMAGLLKPAALARPPSLPPPLASCASSNESPSSSTTARELLASSVTKALSPFRRDFIAITRPPSQSQGQGQAGGGVGRGRGPRACSRARWLRAARSAVATGARPPAQGGAHRHHGGCVGRALHAERRREHPTAAGT